MNHYFTISKFARLRGIDINSLRYYERLGILAPAYTDPHTRYRYYTAEQLSLLDMILLCINLGVPLKELKAYFDESGRFQNRALFEEGKRRTQEKIQELQSSLRSIEHTLTFLEDTARYTQKNTPYRRMIPRRRLVTAPYDGNMNDVNALETAFASLNGYARERQLYPVLPMGMLCRFTGEGFSRAVCWEISEPLGADECIVVLPQDHYLCVQTEWQPQENMDALVKQHFDLRAGETVLISNLGQSRLEPETRTFELQLLPNGAQGGGTDHARPGLPACNTLRAGQESGRAAAKFPTKPTAEGALGG